MRESGKKTLKKKNIEPISREGNEGDEIKNFGVLIYLTKNSWGRQKKHSLKNIFYLLK